MTTASSDDDDPDPWGNIFEDESEGKPLPEPAPPAITTEAVEEEQLVEFEVESHSIKLWINCRGPSVALQLWQSAFLTCRTMAKYQSDLVGKDVLEVGSGLGLCGLVAVKMGARSVTLTDASKPCLASLVRQLDVNFRAKECSEQKSNTETMETASTENSSPSAGDRDDAWQMLSPAVSIRRLLWEDDVARDEGRPLPNHWSNVCNDMGLYGPVPELTADVTFDLIIGSDVLYFPPQARALVSVLRTRLRPGGVALIVMPVRRPALLQDFRDDCEQLGLEVELDETKSLEEVAAEAVQSESVKETTQTLGYRWLRLRKQKSAAQ